MFKAIHGRMQLRGLASRGALHMDCPQGLSPLGSLAVNSPVGTLGPASFLCLGAHLVWESTFPSLSGFVAAQFSLGVHALSRLCIRSGSVWWQGVSG